MTDPAGSRRVIAICYVGWLLDFYDLILLSFLLPFLAPDLGLSPSGQAWLLGGALGASGVGGIFFGWLADRVGRKRVLTWTILLYSIGTTLQAFAPNLAVFLCLRVVTGLGLGGEWAIGHALVAETVEHRNRGKSAALLQTGEPAGVALAAVVGLLVAPVIGWRWVLGLSGLSGLWALVVRARLPESPLWEKAHVDLAARAQAIHWLRSREGLWTVVRGTVLATFKLGTYWTCYIWLPQFFLKRFHEPIGLSALWILTAQVGQFAGMLWFGRLADARGRRPAYLLYSTLSALALGCLAFRWQWLLENRELFWLVMACLGLGSGCTAGFGSLLAELFPTEVRNLAMGTCYNVARGMQLFAPPLVAYFVVRWDLTGALMVPFVFALLTGLWVWTLPETRDRDIARFRY